MATRNVELIGSYVSSGATATASSTAAGYDAQNVVDLVRGTLWKASASGAASVKLDLGSAKAVSGLYLGNHNGDLWTGAKLQRSPDDVTYTDVVTFSGLAAAQDYFHTFGSISYRYWKVLCTGASAAMQIGIVYLGLATELTYNPFVGFGEGDEYGVQDALAQDGSVVAETWARRLISADLSWDTVETAAMAQLRDFLRTEGGRARPFVYVPRDDAAASVSGQAYLVRQVGKGFKRQEVWNGLYKMGLSIVEEV